MSNNDPSTYIRKFRQANILPLALLFEINDLALMLKIIHGYIPVANMDRLCSFAGRIYVLTSRQIQGR